MEHITKLNWILALFLLSIPLLLGLGWPALISQAPIALFWLLWIKEGNHRRALERAEMDRLMAAASASKKQRVDELFPGRDG